MGRFRREIPCDGKQGPPSTERRTALFDSRLFLAIVALSPLALACWGEVPRLRLDAPVAEAGRDGALSLEGGRESTSPDAAADTDPSAPPGAADAATEDSPCAPLLTFMPASLAFPPTPLDQPSEAERFVLSNAGCGPAGTGTALAIAVGEPFAIKSTDCEGTLPAGSSCTVAVVFQPKSPGEVKASLVAEGTPGGPASALLSGSGQAPPALAWAPEKDARADFGLVRIGKSAVQSYRLTNTGQQAARTISVSLTGAQFSLIGATPGECGAGEATLAGGQSCLVRVTFLPQAEGDFSAELRASEGGGRGSPVLNLIGKSRLPIGFIEEFSLPAGSGPSFLVTGPDEHVWVVEEAANRIGRMNLKGEIQHFDIPTPDSRPDGITVGPDQNLWFVEYDGNRVGRITTKGEFKEFDIPTPDSGPAMITTGPDGHLWFTEYKANKIGRITIAGEITEFPIPTPNSQPIGIVAGHDNTLWFAEADVDNGWKNKVGRVVIGRDKVTIQEFPALAYKRNPRSIIRGTNDDFWIAEYFGSRIGHVTAYGAVTEFELADRNGTLPLDLVLGPDGNIWFTQYQTSKLGRMTPGGLFTDFPVGRSAGLYGITVGPDRKIWFTQSIANKVGRITVE